MTPSPLGIPLDNHQLARMEELHRLHGEAYGGWGRNAMGVFFVDIGPRRFHGETLHEAIGAALRAGQEQPR